MREKKDTNKKHILCSWIRTLNTVSTAQVHVQIDYKCLLNSSAIFTENDIEETLKIPIRLQKSSNIEPKTKLGILYFQTSSYILSHQW